MSKNSPQQPLLVDLYEQYLVDQNSAAFIKKVAEQYSVATLERLAGWGRRLSRRAAVLALGYLGDYESNAVLGMALTDRDRGVRTLAEQGIRNVWCRVGGQAQRQCLRAVVRLNNAKQYPDAIDRATALLHQSPWLAEAWYQRGLAHFHLANCEAALKDCHQALEINPYQFLAAARLGQCHLKLGHHQAALDSFRRALRLNPSMEDVRAQIVQLKRLLKDE
ncbi:MAG: tetratricopeptide repeat protein [Pirellulales bacterium]